MLEQFDDIDAFEEVRFVRDIEKGNNSLAEEFEVFVLDLVVVKIEEFGEDIPVGEEIERACLGGELEELVNDLHDHELPFAIAVEEVVVLRKWGLPGLCRSPCRP